MRIVAVCGSLRRESANTNALQALALVVPDVEIYRGLADLPHFNPDLDVEGSTPPAAVAELRSIVRAADVLVISTPEYAHGLPGALKNALDWLVSDGTLADKRVVILNATPPAAFAIAQLVEILKTMNWRVAATIELPLRGKRLTPQEIASDPELASRLRSAVQRALAIA